MEERKQGVKRKAEGVDDQPTPKKTKTSDSQLRAQVKRKAEDYAEPPAPKRTKISQQIKKICLRLQKGIRRVARISQLCWKKAFGRARKEPFIPVNMRATLPPVCCQQNLELVKVLGKGNFGTAILRRSTETSELLVDKMISTTDFGDECAIEDEIEFLTELQGCKEVIQFSSYLKCTQSSDPYVDHHIYMEYFPAINLFEFIAKNYIDEEQRKKILRQLGQGLRFIHSKSIIHCDIKGDNILINDQADIKIIDLGVAQWGPHCNTYRGPINFCAPEAFLCDVPGSDGTLRPYSYESDYFQLGILAYQMEYEISPGHYFSVSLQAGRAATVAQAKEQRRIIPPALSDIFKKLVEKYTLFVVKYPYSADAQYQDLMEGLLEMDPTRRLNDGNFLSHPFLNPDDERLQLERPGAPAQDVKSLTLITIEHLLGLRWIAARKFGRVLLPKLVTTPPAGRNERRYCFDYNPRTVRKKNADYNTKAQRWCNGKGVPLTRTSYARNNAVWNSFLRFSFAMESQRGKLAVIVKSRRERLLPTAAAEVPSTSNAGISRDEEASAPSEVAMDKKPTETRSGDYLEQKKRKHSMVEGDEEHHSLANKRPRTI